MTGDTAIKHYNDWFAANYSGLQKYCRRYHIEEDILNTVYLNVRDRILRSGLTETYYTTYIKHSIKNLQINEAKKNNNKHFIDYDNEDYTNTVEDKLQYNDECEKDTQHYREEVVYFSKKLFEYLMTEGRYNEEWNFVFRCYYLMNGRMTYAKLNTMTGIDKSKCTRIIKTIKKDIRQNFIIWLNDDERRNYKHNE